ncbi:MAG: GNAT family N-acetyltransferase [Flavobacteriaceae bacterium]|nr:GNAT family N-acetyltransferase [Flavobacteriaceae bacterium]
MVKLLRTDANHEGFIGLVRLLDRELAERDGDDHAFYAQFNGIEAIDHVVLALEDDEAVSCGGMKVFNSMALEIKRMYTSRDKRKRGLAALVLKGLEEWASELGYEFCVLETGKRQPEAIALYKKWGYEVIPNFGQYKGIENSVCFKKSLLK